MKAPARKSGWERYYRVVRKIPRGKVSTYGEIARRAGTPRAARQVGYAMAALKTLKDHDVPWHRVLGSRGPGFAAVSLPAESGGTLQRKRLKAEGVAFDPRGRVPLERHGWR